jgi:hypothetical protein
MLRHSLFGGSEEGKSNRRKEAEVINALMRQSVDAIYKLEINRLRAELVPQGATEDEIMDMASQMKREAEIAWLKDYQEQRLALVHERKKFGKC